VRVLESGTAAGASSTALMANPYQSRISRLPPAANRSRIWLGGPRRARRCLGGGVAGDIGVGQRRNDEHPAQEPGQQEHHRGGAHVGSHPQRRVIAPPAKQIGTARIAYVQAVANQVQTRLVPPPTKAGSTTIAGSRRMSGQLNVEDNTIAAAANASAPKRNNPRSSAEAHGRCLPMSYPAAQRRDQQPLRCSEVRRFELCHASSQGQDGANAEGL
jgi:hypothetical protein